MKAYKCDICGKFFCNFKPLELLEKQVSIKSLDGLFVKGKACDICPDCISAIQKVIDERSEEND